MDHAGNGVFWNIVISDTVQADVQSKRETQARVRRLTSFCPEFDSEGIRLSKTSLHQQQLRAVGIVQLAAEPAQLGGMGEALA
jgi:hypothetical protein